MDEKPQAPVQDGFFHAIKLRRIEATAHDLEQDRLSTFRRYIFATWTTAVNLVIVMVIAALGREGLLEQQLISAAYSYIELMAALLLGASVVDRTRLIDKFLPQRFIGTDGSTPTAPINQDQPK